MFSPLDRAWQRADGKFIDPFRPQIQAGGYASIEQLEADRKAHLAAVREVFEGCDVFIFTLGLTESWISTGDGAVFPLAPGVVSPNVASDTYKFHNFTVTEIEADLHEFLNALRKVNPAVRVILTVSPVPLIATYTDDHVLSATSYSKAVLRVVVGQLVEQYDWVDYFPSYEMITGIHTRGSFYEEDLREVKMDGVSYVMSTFSRHYLVDFSEKERSPAPKVLSDDDLARQAEVMNTISHVICDETAIEDSL